MFVSAEKVYEQLSANQLCYDVIAHIMPYYEYCFRQSQRFENEFMYRLQRKGFLMGDHSHVVLYETINKPIARISFEEWILNVMEVSGQIVLLIRHTFKLACFHIYDCKLRFLRKSKPLRVYCSTIARYHDSILYMQSDSEIYIFHTFNMTSDFGVRMDHDVKELFVTEETVCVATRDRFYALRDWNILFECVHSSPHCYRMSGSILYRCSGNTIDIYRNRGFATMIRGAPQASNVGYLNDLGFTFVIREQNGHYIMNIAKWAHPQWNTQTKTLKRVFFAERMEITNTLVPFHKTTWVGVPTETLS